MTRQQNPTGQSGRGRRDGGRAPISAALWSDLLAGAPRGVEAQRLESTGVLRGAEHPAEGVWQLIAAADWVLTIRNLLASSDYRHRSADSLHSSARTRSSAWRKKDRRQWRSAHFVLLTFACILLLSNATFTCQTTK